MCDSLNKMHRKIGCKVIPVIGANCHQWHVLLHPKGMFRAPFTAEHFVALIRKFCTEPAVATTCLENRPSLSRGCPKVRQHIIKHIEPRLPPGLVMGKCWFVAMGTESGKRCDISDCANQYDDAKSHLGTEKYPQDRFTLRDRPTFGAPHAGNGSPLRVLGYSAAHTAPKAVFRYHPDRATRTFGESGP